MKLHLKSTFEVMLDLQDSQSMLVGDHAKNFFFLYDCRNKTLVTEDFGLCGFNFEKYVENWQS